MATISKTRSGAFDIKNSVQLKYAISYVTLIVALMIFMNLYPVASFRDAILESKYASMQNQAAVVASSLSALSVMDSDDVSKVMALLDNIQMTRIVVTDRESRIVYDTSPYEDNVGKYALFSEITRALTGKNVFYSKCTLEVILSRASIPVMHKGAITGAVYIYDFDTEQAGMLDDMRGNLVKVSLLVLLASLLLVIVFSGLLTGRIRTILKAIRTLGGGSYGYRINVKGGDEISELASEFNTLAERLQKTEEMRQRFVSDASHELKTPLSAIRLLTDSILQNDDMDKATMREFIQDIGSEAERLTRTTEKLLDITRLQNHDGSKRVLMDMRRVVEKAMRMLERLAEAKKVSLEVKLSSRCPIRANPDDVHQVVFNLVENAIKYNVEGGSVTVLLFTKDDRVNFLVNDTGVGIPATDLPHIFDRFYRVDKSRESEVGGSGLGLSIVKEMVSRYGGDISATPREHGGTSFRVTFPQGKARPGEKTV